MTTTQAGLISLILLLLTVISIPLGLYAVRRQQLLGTKAQTNNLTADTNPSEAGSCNACSADVNKDGIVTVDDLAIAKACATKLPSKLSCDRADLDKTGKIDSKDIDCVRQQLEKKCTVLHTKESPTSKKQLLY